MSTAVIDSVGAQRLHDTWEDPPGISGWLCTVDHKRIGTRYFITAIAFLVIGGIEAVLIRSQLLVPGNDLLDPDTYNRLMTMHGTTMILLFNTPMLAAFGNYLVPLQIGSRDMAFPRLNALSYWIFVLSGVFIYTSFLVGEVPDGGWFAYTPLTSSEYSPGAGMDFWAIGVTFLGISTTVGAVNFVVTILRMRAPGMSLNRMPIFVWGILAMALMIVFALPAITLAGSLLELDRAFGMDWFNPDAGGRPLLYQHLFWIWGHPEVYIVFIPATGIISMVIPTFCRRPIAGYHLVVAPLAATAFISFGLWVHHMFATGVPLLVASFFSAASLLVAIPSGVQIFAWLATIMRATKKIRFEPPMLFAIGFIVLFVIGGMTGVMVGVGPFDLQVTDSYFVVAHFHYVLIGGSVFPIFAGLHFWWPKITGRMPHRRRATIAFWAMFIGFNVAFFPQHFLGLMGMPRRVYTYQPGLGWDDLNLLSSLGAYVLAAGFALAIANLVMSRYRGDVATPNPWDSESLEWATASPPPPHNFDRFPVVESANPLWDRTADQPLPEASEVGGESVLAAPHGHHRTLLTSALDADRLELTTMPGPSYWPLVLALGLLVISTGVLIVSWIVGTVDVVATVVAMVRWQVELAELKGAEG